MDTAAIMRRNEYIQNARGRSYCNNNRKSSMSKPMIIHQKPPLHSPGSLQPSVSENAAMDEFPAKPDEVGHRTSNDRRNSMFSQISQSSRQTSYESDDDYRVYPGIEDDKEWTQKIMDDQQKGDIVNDQDIYKRLVEHMGIFRWQALHGFHFDQYGGHHIQPKFGNIKQVPFCRVNE